MSCSPERPSLLGALSLAVLAVAATAAAEDGPAEPWIDRIEPLGGRIGADTAVTVVGRDLPPSSVIVFDSPALTWLAEPAGGKGELRGTVRVAPDAPPGPHIVTLSTSRGRSNSRLFYAHQLPASEEAEPNDTLAGAQPIRLVAQTLHGSMPALPDVDVFRFEAAAGERWTFDLRSLEYGGFLENNLTLLDGEGTRVAFNDDRDDFLETPFLEHVFERSGTHYLKLDQYRGPQRVNCNRNCGYMLRIGQLPVIRAAFPLGARPGRETAISVRGRGLADTRSVWIVPVRRAEYYRLTFPFSIPVSGEPRPSEPVRGTILSRSESEVSSSFAIPADAWLGLWRLWVGTPGGATDSVSLVVSDRPEPDCASIRPDARGAACNGLLEADRPAASYRLELRADQPFVATTQAAQLGLPRIDTVLELFDADGKLVAEHDDLMTGQGTVIGNPDSMLAFRAPSGGTYRLMVRDRTGRTGPDMAYRLVVEEREPRFALLTDPEALNARPGATVRIGALLVPEPGFEGEVTAWVEAPATGIAGGQGSFRAGQFFGPSGDGDNIVIPTAQLEISLQPDLLPGDYPLRVFGRAEGSSVDVEALPTLWIGPPIKRNDVRRPVEALRLAVVEPEPESRPSQSSAGAAR